jgi:hypothetical protein
MVTKRWATIITVALGISFSTVGCAPEAANTPEIRAIQSQQEEYKEISASSEIVISFTKTEVLTTPAPPVVTPIRKASEATAVEAVADKAVSVGEQTTVARESAVQQGPSTRLVHVALAGGQSVVDLQKGPVLFPLPAGFPPYVAEHDYAGGWARFGTLTNGMKVTMSGLVTGSYTVGQVITVPKRGTTDEFRKFAVTPKVLLQTCIPGTDKMVVVGLY